MNVAAKTVSTAEQYLAWERSQAQKPEYLASDVFSVVGASDAHVTVSGRHPGSDPASMQMMQN